MFWRRWIRLILDWWRRLWQAIRRWFDSLDGGGDKGNGGEPDDDEVPTGELDLQDDREVISPPVLKTPLYACAEVIVVLSFLPHADLEFEIDGATFTEPGDFPEPGGQAFPLPAALEPNQQVRARQHHDGRTSGWTPLFTVRSHTEDYPAGPPRPQISPAPVHECGSRTGVANLLTGCHVWIEANGAERGRVEGAKEHQGVNVNPDYGRPEDVQAFASLCDDLSPGSVVHPTQPPPSPLLTPTVDQTYENQEQIKIVGLANGARFNLVRNGTDLGWWRTWGQAHLVGMAPLGPGDTLEVKQRLCPSEPDSGTGTTTTEPCASLPAPKVGPMQAGDESVVVTEAVPGAVIRIYASLAKVGEGTGSPIALVRPVEHGETVHVTQSLGGCTSSTARQVGVRCVDPPVGGAPAGYDLFPIGHTDYDGGTFVFDGTTYSVKGTVFYPAEADGSGQPFNKRLADLGRVPIVFTAHGNHATWRNPADHNQEDCVPHAGWEEIPNHRGYDYFLRDLAKMGVIAVAVYSNETNCTGYSATNMRHRAEVIRASIEHFVALDGGGDPIFGDAIDFDRTGLMGHSRGGEAVVTLPEVITVPGVNIRGVISLAPTDAGASTGQPRDYDLLVILPAADGDVKSTPGARFYDQAEPATFRSQLYIDGANHNFFNRNWPKDEGKGPNRPTRHQHERILTEYGCAFFRAVLLGHATTGYLVGTVLPAGVITTPVHLSFGWSEREVVDHHEDGNGIGTNSLGEPTSQLSGLVATEVDHRQTSTACNPGDSTYYGRTTRMEARNREANGEFRSQLNGPQQIQDFDIWIRAAELHDPPQVPPDNVQFDLGVEWEAGGVSWVNSEGVGGVPAIYDRGDCYNKTMLTTLRFPGGCFDDAPEEGRFVAIRLRLPGEDRRTLVFDDLELIAK